MQNKKWGRYYPVTPIFRPCIYCGKLTKYQWGILGHHVCPKCRKRWP